LPSTVRPARQAFAIAASADRDDIVALQHDGLPSNRLCRFDVDDRDMADDDIALFRGGKRWRYEQEQRRCETGKQAFHGGDLSRMLRH
jgi:hypothetical protein